MDPLAFISGRRDVHWALPRWAGRGRYESPPSAVSTAPVVCIGKGDSRCISGARGEAQFEARELRSLVRAFEAHLAFLTPNSSS